MRNRSESDFLGRHVERALSTRWEAGYHTVQLDFTGKAAGLYFLQAEASGVTRVQKVMFLR
ncbi:hypothetical protein KKH27_07540 [bacterium]|nr:hypothetical protein [bacterium]MBU1984711.1 hypothetical protein [bacterium]